MMGGCEAVGWNMNVARLKRQTERRRIRMGTCDWTSGKGME